MRIVQPLYWTSSRSFLSRKDRRIVVSGGPVTPSGGGALRDVAFPGPAGRAANFVLEAYGDTGGFGDVSAW